MVFAQADGRWGHEILKVKLTVGNCGCVLTSFTEIVNMLLGTSYTPLEVLRKAQATKGAFVDGAGKEPGDLLVIPVLCEAYGLACDDVVANAPDHDDVKHEFSNHLVSSDADVAGALAAALVGGQALVRVDLDGDGRGDHTLSGKRQEGENFVCNDPAPGSEVTLDANLENPAVPWGDPKNPHCPKKAYRCVNVRAIYLRETTKKAA